MIETQNNLCIIKDFKEKETEKHFIKIAKNFTKSKNYNKAMRISCTSHRVFPDSKEIIFTYAQSIKFLLGDEKVNLVLTNHSYNLAIKNLIGNRKFKHGLEFSIM